MKNVTVEKLEKLKRMEHLCAESEGLQRAHTILINWGDRFWWPLRPVMEWVVRDFGQALCDAVESNEVAIFKIHKDLEDETTRVKNG